jgi:hypothetical protein
MVFYNLMKRKAKPSERIRIIVFDFDKSRPGLEFFPLSLRIPCVACGEQAVFEIKPGGDKIMYDSGCSYHTCYLIENIGLGVRPIEVKQ